MKEQPAVAMALRARLLGTKPSDVGLTPSDELPRVWAALMEWKMDANTVTLAAVADGTTSLYFSTGGGIIGGGEHDTVRKANRKFLVVMDKLLPLWVAKEPLAMVDTAVCFVALTYDGTHAGRDTEERLKTKKSPAWPAFYLGHDVIAQLRLSSPKLT